MEAILVQYMLPSLSNSDTQVVGHGTRVQAKDTDLQPRLWTNDDMYFGVL